MLQIISGKFFKSDNLQTSAQKDILYSNYSWVGKIETSIATLEPVDTFGSSVCSYILSYVNQLEGEFSPGMLVPGKSWEVVRQFQLLCTFNLKATFDVDRNLIELNCREKQKHSGDQYLPSKFTTRFFNPVINGTQHEIDHFIKLIKKVIGLPRKEYIAVIRCLTNFSDALQALNFNLDLAYSMLIYSLEALCQNFDRYITTWQDYPQNKEMDKLLSNIESALSENIRTLLIKDQHLKLTKRFVDFITSHIDESFYCQEATNIQNALRKSDLEQALKNAYNSRSKYVHSLSPIKNYLKYSSITQGDVFHSEKQPYLTFNGLVRLTHHVITNFIARQKDLEQEDYDYHQDIPGILKFKLVPQYWLGDERYFSASQARKWLSGFLENLLPSLVSEEPLVDLEKVMQKLEKTIKGVSEEHQITMLVLHRLFYCLTGNSQKHLPLENTYSHLIKKCHIETMLASLILTYTLPWKLSECVYHYESYLKNRFKTNIVTIPLVIEILLIVEIANMYLKIEQIELYEKWLTTARLEAAGMPTVQNLIQESKVQKVSIQLNDILESLKSKKT